MQKQIFAVSDNSPPAQPVVRACCIKRPPVFTRRWCSWSATTPACLPLVLLLPAMVFTSMQRICGVAVIKAGTPIEMVTYAMSLAGDPATPGARR